MPEPMLSDKYQIISFKSLPIVSQRRVCQRPHPNYEDLSISASVDETWQRKGFTSLNGGVTAISIDSRKVFDTAILFKFVFLWLYLIMTLLLNFELYY